MKAGRGRIRFSRAFRYFILCYIVLLLCVLALCAGVYAGTRRALIEDAMRISRLELERCGSEIDRMISSAGEATLQMSRSEELRKLTVASEEMSGEVAYDFYMALKTFNARRPITFSFDGAYLFYPTSDRVVTMSTVYQSSETFYRQCVTGGDYAGWRQKLGVRGLRSELFQTEDTLGVLNDISILYPRFMQAVSCFYISKSRVEQTMSGDYAGSGYCILNRAGETMAGNLAPAVQRELEALLAGADGRDTVVASLAGREWLIAIRQADSRAARYVSVIPTEAVYARIRSVELTLGLSVLAILFVALMLGLALSWRNTKLIRGFASIVSPEDKALDDEFNALHDGIQGLRSENSRYQNLLIRQRTSLRTAFLFRLLAGEYPNEGDILGAMNEAGLALNGAAYAAAAVRCPESDNGARLRVTAAFEDRHLLNPVDENTYAALLVLPEAAREAAEAAADDMLKLMPQGALICLGGVCDSLNAVAGSYAEAKTVLAHAPLGAAGVLGWQTAETGRVVCPYTYEAEGRLLALVRTGAVAEAQSFMQSLFEAAEGSERLELVRSLNLTRLRAGQESGMDALPGFYADDRSDIREAFDRVSRALVEMAADKRASEASHSDQLEIRIRKHIMEHYRDPLLSLSSIAEAVNLSEPYLSGFFKKKTGENISSYIEQLRVDQAYHLLAETDLPITDVAAQCGYQSDQTFRRAFKKLIGCTPGQIRQG